MIPEVELPTLQISEVKVNAVASPLAANHLLTIVPKIK